MPIASFCSVPRRWAAWRVQEDRGGPSKLGEGTLQARSRSSVGDLALVVLVAPGQPQTTILNNPEHNHKLPPAASALTAFTSPSFKGRVSIVRTSANGLETVPEQIKKAASGQRADFPEGIEECGTDALRFALVAYTSQGRDSKLYIKRVVFYRHWCSKLWNAIRFAMINLGTEFQPSETLDVASFPFASWILSKLNAAVATTVKGMEAYEFSAATSAVYSFWQYKALRCVY
ncbi:hypothetical protein D9Q98_006386 [Chlorella vulgaris]|uniref:valine--tRNA ligase n=1 Tax=Chlorella vulgaris TaxID=3077 RepID=A0A9D4TK99_CHLVU|nr:hypothetical protein D9Q98_006386 [Chlorella vulgaris]